jgi:hypothetical protein
VGRAAAAAGGLCRRRRQANGSGGLGACWSVRVGFGDAGEGDFEAEGFDLADVVGDLAAGGGLPFVVVRAEVLVPHAWISQQLGGPQLGVADRDLGFGLAAAAGQLA